MKLTCAYEYLQVATFFSGFEMHFPRAAIVGMQDATDSNVIISTTISHAART
jgi:hypothetical protein